MLFAAYEPGQEMAIANLSLAIFCVFTISLPFLLITRGDKTEANREFLISTVNPWSQIKPELELAPIVDTGVISINENTAKLEVVPDANAVIISESDELLSTEPKVSEEFVEASSLASTRTDEAIAA